MLKNKILNKYKNLKSVINKMIYSPPKERPSALQILYNKNDWIIESDDDVSNQVSRFQMDKSHTLLKFLEIKGVSQTNPNPSVISDIKLTEEIGSGTYGKVYKVFYQTQYYAVKRISIENVARTYLDNNRELEIMKQLKSDFVVNLYDYWIKSENDFEFLYIQMELCDQTLKDIINEKNTSFPPIIHYMIRTEIFRQLLEALNYLHSMTPKVIHRDIKPSNVLIKYHNDYAICKVCDFGLAKIFEKDLSNTSNVGTGNYRAPEMKRNHYDEKIDIYSLGMTLIELFKNLLLTKDDDIKIYSKLNDVINKMVYSPPEERSSALDILGEKSDWLMKIENDLGMINLIKKIRKENTDVQLKFLHYYYSN